MSGFSRPSSDPPVKYTVIVLNLLITVPFYRVCQKHTMVFEMKKKKNRNNVKFVINIDMYIPSP